MTPPRKPRKPRKPPLPRCPMGCEAEVEEYDDGGDTVRICCYKFRHHKIGAYGKTRAEAEARWRKLVKR